MAYYNGKEWVSTNSVSSNSAGSNSVKKNGTNANKKVNSSYDSTRPGPSYGGYGYNASNTGAGQSYKDQIKAAKEEVIAARPSGSSSSSSSGGSGGSYSSSTYEEYIPQEEPEFELPPFDPMPLIQDYSNYLNQRAAEAYNRSMDIVNNYYNTAKSNLEKNYNESIGTLDRNNAQNTSAINADAEEALRQAYINNMLSRKSLQQAMTAQGLNGGATETTRASLENNYGNARNSIDTTRNRNLAELLSQYQNNLAGIRQQYNTGLSELDANKLNYAMQINSDIQDRLNGYVKDLTDYISTWTNENLADDPLRSLKAMEMSKSYGQALDDYNRGEIAANLGSGTTGYVNALQNLAAKSSNFNLTPSEVINTYDPSSMQQAGMYTGSNYAKMLAAQELMNNSNQSALNTTLNNNNNVSSLAQVLKALAAQYGA